MLSSKLLWLVFCLSIFHLAKQDPIPPEGDLIKFRTQLMYSYLKDFIEIDSSKPYFDQTLPFFFPFFDNAYRGIRIHRNGQLSFFYQDKDLQQLAAGKPNTTISPWLARQDIPVEEPHSGVYYRLIDMSTEKNQTLKRRLELDFSEGMIGAGNFKPSLIVIVTWRNMTMANRRPEKPLVTNTYQCLIATDTYKSYAMFNYEKIQWVTDKDNYEGVNGTAAFVGFQSFNKTVEFFPYSRNPYIYYLTKRGFGNGLRGRFFFQINKNISVGACRPNELKRKLPDPMPLTFSPRWASRINRTLVNVTGPCLSPKSKVVCQFGKLKSQAEYKSPNHASCLTPLIDRAGFVNLTVTADDRTSFVGRFSFV